jgi:hypothetical protein
MTRSSNPLQLNRLSEQVGSFIEYWGFKKIHGMIWTHLYLSPKPVSAQELIARLKVSKALVSLSIKDLLYYNLILQTDESLNKKNKFYIANPDVFSVIRNILETRELEMMKRIGDEFKALHQNHQEKPSTDLLDEHRLKNLGDMISGADSALKSLLQLSAMDPSFFQYILENK